MGLGRIAGDAPSPIYLRVLAVWMWVFGISVPSAVALNLTCYALSTLAILAAASHLSTGATSEHHGTLVPIVAITFSPAFLIFGTQPLKDSLCMMFVIVVLAGAAAWWNGWTTRVDRIKAASGAVLMATAIYGVAGIRAYVAAFMIPAFLVSAVYSAATGPAGPGRLPRAVAQMAMLIVLCIAFLLGAGAYAGRYQEFVTASVRSPGTVASAFDDARDRFVAAGGQTSVDLPGSVSAVDTVTRAKRLARGAAILVIPISLDRASLLVKFSGGAGLLWVTDLDTLATDAAVAIGLILVLKTATIRTLHPSAVFAVMVGTLLAGSLAYVVTNYGTLFRLRALMVTPFWMLPALLNPSDERFAELADGASQRTTLP